MSRRNPAQFALVGVQVALAVTLLAGAGLLLRSFQELGRVSPGFDPERVLTFHISTSWGETADQKGSKQRVAGILDALRSVPGVEAAATSIELPGVPNQYQIELKPPEARAETEPKLLAQGRWVTPEYFATMRIPVVAGELCREEAGALTSMVNRSFADLYFGGSTAIGRHLIDAADPRRAPSEIRGIVGDAREMGIDREPPPTVYRCANAVSPARFSWCAPGRPEVDGRSDPPQDPRTRTAPLRLRSHSARRTHLRCLRRRIACARSCWHSSP